MKLVRDVASGHLFHFFFFPLFEMDKKKIITLIKYFINDKFTNISF